jgi:hypothetical protein
VGTTLENKKEDKPVKREKEYTREISPAEFDSVMKKIVSAPPINERRRKHGKGIDKNSGV